MKLTEIKEGLTDFVEELKEFDPNELSMDNIGTWPAFVKVGAFIVAFVGMIGLGFYFSINTLLQTHESAKRKELQLKETFRQKAFMAANLQAYRDQMKEMEISFGALVSQLPSDTEVPGLLEDITNKGSLSGLDIKSIDLDDEVSREFYVELPIDIVVQGSYHDMGSFVSGVASLPRIVTLSSFTIQPEGKEKVTRGSAALEMRIKAFTYRYKNVDEINNKRKTRS